jgi:hypothetical protein
MSYRQLNYVYGFLRDYVAGQTRNVFEQKLKPYITEFLKQLDGTGYIDSDLIKNGKSRTLSLFNNGIAEEYFGDVYTCKYSCSFVAFAHLNRHRTLKYYISTPGDELDFYIPELIADNKKLKAEWLKDLNMLKKNYPQAMIVNVVEMGNLDDFILKVIERKCSAVQLETTRVVNDILRKYQQSLSLIGHCRGDELKKMQNGARCTFPDYNCPNPCAFGDGIKETRKI